MAVAVREKPKAGDEFDEGVIVGAVPKNAREEIRVRLTEFKEFKLVDIRTFYEPENSQEKRPCGKGFAIRRDLLPELIEVLQKAQRMSGEGV